jgi:hypothetical protein
MNRAMIPIRVVAIGLLLVLPFNTGTLRAAASPATLVGRVVSAETQKPLEGALVHVADPATGTLRTSSPTLQDGTFTVAQLAPARYEVAVQSGGGLYPVPGAVSLSAGESRRVKVALRQEEPTPKEGGESEKAGLSVWNNPLTATLIVVGSALVVGLVVDSMSNDEEQPASAH